MKVSCVPILGILGYVIVNLDRKKNIKKRRILDWKFINSLLTQKLLDVQSWKSDTMWVPMNALCKPSLGLPGHVTKTLQPKVGKNLKNFNRCISVITDVDKKWFVVFEHLSTTFLLVMFVYLNLKAFYCFVSFFFFFSSYLLLNN